MITVHGGHGWMLSQFVSLFAIIDSIRRHVGPKIPIDYNRWDDGQIHSPGV